jgi:hypothetical protein
MLTTKTYSQKLARFFEIFGYLLILPAFVGVLLSFLLIDGVGYSLEPNAPKPERLFGLPILAILVFLLGTILLVGYFLHSHNKLNKALVILMWIGTSVFNLPFFAIVIYSMRINLTEIFVNQSEISSMLDFSSIYSIAFTLIKLIVCAYYIAAFILPITAIISNIKNQYQLNKS